MREQTFRRRAASWIMGGALAVGALGAAPARADLERFAYTYGWSTPARGEAELEISHAQPADGRNWQDTVSVEYGVSDRYMIEPYVIFNRSGGFGDVPVGGDEDEEGGEGGSQIFDPILNGAALRYGGFKVEQRYRFGDYAFNKVLAAAYLEYAQLRGARPELESKLILQWDPNRRGTVVLNLIAEQPLRQGTKTELGYSLAGAYFLDQKNDRYWLGAEAFGNWTEKQHWAGPSAGFYLNDRTRLVGTYGKQLRGSGGDQFRLLLTRELN